MPEASFIGVPPTWILDAIARGDDRALVDEVARELQTWRTGRDLGKSQRAIYALVRLLGPSAPVVAEGLAEGGMARWTVLEALLAPWARDGEESSNERFFTVLPSELLPPLRALLQPQPAKGKKKQPPKLDEDAPTVVRAILRIESDEVPALLATLAENEVTQATIAAAVESGTASRRTHVSPALRSRFERALAVIEQSRTAGLPSPLELSTAGSLAALIESDRDLAKRAVAIFDLIPGYKSAPPGAVIPIASFLRRSIDLLEPADWKKLASLIAAYPFDARLPATAAAWMRLDPEETKPFVLKLNGLSLADKATVDRALADAAPPERAVDLLRAAIGRARQPADLLPTLQLAAGRKLFGVTGAVLEKLRETPFRVEPALEALLPSLFGAEVFNLVEREIDGDNPFRDRREALARALAKARA